MASLLDKLAAASTIKASAPLDESELFNNTFLAPTAVPMLNVALSGNLAGGVTAGVTMYAGPSKHFKTLFAMICAKGYLDKYPDAVIKFYDSEFGAGLQYFKSLKIDTARILHTPITNAEELKHDIMNTLTQIERGEHVLFLYDSMGNTASKKEVEDAEEGKSVADMTRAKAFKSLFRMIVPVLMLKDLPFIVVNHTYRTLEMFSKDVVGGGTGAYYGANQIFIIGRQQEKGKGKEEKVILGYNFIINVEKSRFVKEKSKIPISVMFDGGVNTWSGLLDIAQESGHVVKPANGTYAHKGSQKKYKEDDTNSKEFWMPILTDPTFQEFIRNKYALGQNELLSTELTDDEVADGFEDATAATEESAPAEEKAERRARRNKKQRRQRA